MNNIHIKNIADGVRLFTCQTSRFKTNRISLVLALPLNSSVSANAVLPYILTRSCKDYPDFTGLNKRLADLYDATVIRGVQKAGDSQLIHIGLSFIDDRFALEENESISANAAKLLLQMLFEPKFKDGEITAEDLELEKRLLVETIKSELNNKRAYAMKRCTEIMFKNDAYSINALGNIDEIEKLTSEDIFNAWKNALQSATIQVNIIGNCNVEKIEKEITDYFSTVDRKPFKPETKFVTEANEVSEHREKMNINQSKLVIGMRTGMKNPTDNIAAFYVANALFGGIPTSLLFSHVREELSLCYYCSSQLQRGKGVMFVQSGIEEAHYNLAKTEILKQLEVMCNNEFSDEAFDAAKRSLRDSLGGVYDTPSSINSWYITQVLSDEILKPEVLSEGISKVTREDVCSVAKTIVPDTIYLLEGEADTDED